MIRAAVGFSRARDPLQAADEAVNVARQSLGDARPDWCAVFATGEYHDDAPVLLGRLADVAETPYVVGCSAAGILTADQEIEGGPALGVLLVSSDTLRATPFLFEGGNDLGYRTGVRLGERLVGSKRREDLVLVWPDPFRVRPDRLLRGLDDTLDGVPVAGAASASDLEDGATFQFCGDDFRDGGVSGIRLGGEFRYRVVVTQGCRPIGQPLRVTEAHENLIMEIDGRPALEALRDRAPKEILDNPDIVFNSLFVGLLPDGEVTGVRPGEYFVRNIVTADPDTGVLAIGGTVQEGQRIVFAVREGGSAREDLLRTIRQMESGAAGVDYRFGLYFNCRSRGRSLYGEDGVDSRLLRKALPDVPLLGFFCNAEMAPLRGINRLFTYTGVLVLVGE